MYFVVKIVFVENLVDINEKIATKYACLWSRKMKKILILLLVAVVCLMFVGCESDSEKNHVDNTEEVINIQASDKKIENDIVGTWEMIDENNYDSISRDMYLVFTDDHKGYYIRYHRPSTFDDTYEERKSELIWKYDEDFDCYLYTIPGSAVQSCIIESEDGKEYINSSGMKFYRQETNG
jgi:hypothetical protein